MYACGEDKHAVEQYCILFEYMYMLIEIFQKRLPTGKLFTKWLNRWRAQFPRNLSLNNRTGCLKAPAVTELPVSRALIPFRTSVSGTQFYSSLNKALYDIIGA